MVELAISDNIWRPNFGTDGQSQTARFGLLNQPVLVEVVGTTKDGWWKRLWGGAWM